MENPEVNKDLAVKILKLGAYHVFTEDKSSETQAKSLDGDGDEEKVVVEDIYNEKNIDQILSENSRIIKFTGNDPTAQNSTLSKAHFVLSEEMEKVIDDPNFWDAIGLSNREQFDENNWIVTGPRSRKPPKDLYSFNEIAQSRLETLDKRPNSPEPEVEDEDFKLEDVVEPSDEIPDGLIPELESVPSEKQTHQGKAKTPSQSSKKLSAQSSIPQRKHSEAKVNAPRSKNKLLKSRMDVKLLILCLCRFGFGRWSRISLAMSGTSHSPLSESYIEKYSLFLVLFSYISSIHRQKVSLSDQAGNLAPLLLVHPDFVYAIANLKLSYITNETAIPKVKFDYGIYRSWFPLKDSQFFKALSTAGTNLEHAILRSIDAIYRSTVENPSGDINLFFVKVRTDLEEAKAFPLLGLEFLSCINMMCVFQLFTSTEMMKEIKGVLDLPRN
jgi:hypothetical protein